MINREEEALPLVGLMVDIGTLVLLGGGGDTMMSVLVYGSSLSVPSVLISYTNTVYSPGSDSKHCDPVVSDPFTRDALNVRIILFLKLSCSARQP